MVEARLQVSCRLEYLCIRSPRQGVGPSEMYLVQACTYLTLTHELLIVEMEPYDVHPLSMDQLYS